ncbi:hypothetical protein KDL45_08185, partial [bacterium]|nr:hypothetical protein [bacterium]
MRRRYGWWVLVLALIAATSLAVACGDDDDDDTSADDDIGDDDDDTDDDTECRGAVCDEDDDDTTVDGVDFSNDPPTNPYLAGDIWPMSHRNPYCQGSSPYPGPTSDDGLHASFLTGTPASITMTTGLQDESGDAPLWGSTLNEVYLIDASEQPMVELSVIRKPKGVSNPIGGAYTLADADGFFFVPRNNRLYAYRNNPAGNPYGKIVLAGIYTLPGDSDEESIIGLNMTYDGFLVYATDRGRIGVVSRDFSDEQVFQLSDEDEEMSNSIAVDENGGVYVVTSKFMHRVQWTGEELTQDTAAGAWSAAYETGPEDRPPGRLGVGSGSTPSLMGIGDQDKFVVITDGQILMHLVLFWRDEIPEDWEPIAPGKDRRIAAEVPITFGDPEAEISSSEQSVLVRGYDAVVVSNYYGRFALPSYFAALVSNFPLWAPYGVEKFSWNPTTRTL